MSNPLFRVNQAAYLSRSDTERDIFVLGMGKNDRKMLPSDLLILKPLDLKSTVLKNPQIRSTFRNKSVEYISVSVIDTSCLVLSRKYVHDGLPFVSVLGDIISVQYL